jgi:PleD family two-component response regulator
LPRRRRAAALTVSCGVAASEDGDKDALVAAADLALYRAKHAGKNRTMRAAEPTAAPR